MSTETAYRSSHPAVTAAIAEHQRVRDEFITRAEAWASSYGDSLKPLVLHGHSIWLAGITPTDGDPPDGFRLTERAQWDAWVPDKRFKAGKAAAAAMKEIGDIRDLRGRLPGMPGEVIDGNHWYRPSLGEHGGQYYVGWAIDIEDDSQGRIVFLGPKEIDRTIWERIKLSEYYAAKEATDVARATA